MINPIAAISAVAMLLEQSGYPGRRCAGPPVRAARHRHKMKSQAAGKMGYSTSQVGDLVVAHLE